MRAHNPRIIELLQSMRGSTKKPERVKVGINFSDPLLFP